MYYLYNCYAEKDIKDYKESGMWVQTKNTPQKLRAFSLLQLATQTVFSIRTLKLFEPDAKVIIRTNHPDYLLFKWLKKEYKNIEITDCAKLYADWKTKPFWCYRIRYDALLETPDDVVMIDADTYFIEKPNIIMDDKTCWISMGHNMGILGLTKNNCLKLVPEIVKQINEKADPEGKENRAIDETITLATMLKYGIKTIETKDWIFHYYHDEQPFKFVYPTEDIYEDLKKKVLNRLGPDAQKEYFDKDNKKVMLYPWVQKWKELRQRQDINILELLQRFDDYADNYWQNEKR